MPPVPSDPLAPHEDESAKLDVSRRSFIQTLGFSAAAGAVAREAEAIESGAATRERLDAAVIGPDPVTITLTVNGARLAKRIDPATTLLDALRIDHGLTGSKEVCDRGACGGCTVMVDGRIVASCMMLAADAEGAEITTIEGVGGGGIDDLQEAFIRHDALQCGFCTPGLLVACRALLDANPKPTLDEIKHGLSGNICRCGTYTNIFNAVLDVSGQAPISDTLASLDMLKQGRP
ncbi:MAG: (2Fe-2S)-binding protein [Planctomycetota bacterium]|jgi:aerobic-type carbon monoxide dehydrogenase small subunit (CoxS/CutS family)